MSILFPLPATKPVTHAPSATTAMAQKSFHEYSVPVVANVPVGPAINKDNGNFELKTGLIMMVQANPFHGLPSEDANAHLQHFLELCDTVVMESVTPKMIRLRVFLFSL